MFKHGFTLSVAILLVFILHLFLVHPSQAQQGKKVASPLVGKWKFERFEYFGYLVDVPKAEQERNDKMNRGLVILFDSTGTYIASHPGGPEQNNYQTRYRIINNGKQFIALGDTITIRVVTDSQLKLYSSDDRPLIVFRKLP